MDKDLIVFYNLIKPIISTDSYQSMKQYNHHGGKSIFHHSILVTYLVYKHYKDKKIKYDLKEIIKGSLLHDYYLYDWHSKTGHHRFHGFRHPAFSLKNAERDYGPLTKLEKDIIKHHMFPLVLLFPRTKVAFMVSHYDKKASLIDYFSKKHKKR